MRTTHDRNPLAPRTVWVAFDDVVVGDMARAPGGWRRVSRIGRNGTPEIAVEIALEGPEGWGRIRNGPEHYIEVRADEPATSGELADLRRRLPAPTDRVPWCPLYGGCRKCDATGANKRECEKAYARYLLAPRGKWLP